MRMVSSTTRQVGGVAVAGAGLALAGLVAWAVAIGLQPALTAAGFDAMRYGDLRNTISAGTQLVLLLDAHDLRLVALLVVAAGVALLVTGVPRFAARPVPPLLAVGAALLVANLAWGLVGPGPSDVPVLVVTTTAVGLLAGAAAVRRHPAVGTEIRTNRTLRLVPALFVAGAGFALAAQTARYPELAPFVPPAYLDLLDAVRVLLVGAAVVGGIAVGRRALGVRVAAGIGLAAVVLALGDTARSIGLLGAGVLVLAWTGERGGAAGIRTIGVLVAAAVPVVGGPVLTLLGSIIGLFTLTLSVAWMGADGMPMIGAGLLLGAVLVAVDLACGRRDVERPSAAVLVRSVVVRLRPTDAVGLALTVAGLLVWAGAIALMPTMTAAGLAADRAGVTYDAGTGMGRWLLGELSDVRFAAMVVIGVGLWLIVAGRPVPGGRAGPGLLGAAAVLFGANVGWGLVPGVPVAVVAGSTGLALAAVVVAVLRSGTHVAPVGPAPAVFAAGFVLLLSFGASTSPYLLPFVPPAHPDLVLAVRLLVVSAAVAAACASGGRCRARAVAGAVVVAVGGALILAGRTNDLLDNRPALVGLAAVATAVLVLVWSGRPAPAGRRARQVVGAAFAVLVGAAVVPVLTVPGLFATVVTNTLAGVGLGDFGFTGTGISVVYGLVLLLVYRFGSGPRDRHPADGGVEQLHRVQQRDVHA